MRNLLPEWPFDSRHEAAGPAVIDVADRSAPAPASFQSAYEGQLEALSEAEQRALHLVEVVGASYDETAADLGIHRDQVQVLICDGRRKIYRGVQQALKSA